MKKIINSTVCIVLSLVFIVCLAACNPSSHENSDENIWDSATYLEDTEIGSGAKTIIVEVKAIDKLVTLTVKTDKDTVGAALLEYDLIAGEDGRYGLYVKKVNNILADYDVNGYYWAFYIDGEIAMTGVDGTAIEEGVTYTLEYAKG